MQQVRLWEITADRKLSEILARYASLEQWIEDWLADDISVLDAQPPGHRSGRFARALAVPLTCYA